MNLLWLHAVSPEGCTFLARGRAIGHPVVEVHPRHHNHRPYLHHILHRSTGRSPLAKLRMAVGQAHRASSFAVAAYFEIRIGRRLAPSAQ